MSASSFSDTHVQSTKSRSLLWLSGVLIVGIACGWWLWEAAYCPERVRATLKGKVRTGPLLQITNTDASGEDLRFVIESLCRCQSTRVLRLTNLNLTGQDLVQVSRLTSLTSLTLDSQQITDADLQSLAPLTNLKYLHVQSPRITDAGMAAVLRLPTLRTFLATGTVMTANACDEFRRLRPDALCGIEKNHPE